MRKTGAQVHDPVVAEAGAQLARAGIHGDQARVNRSDEKCGRSPVADLHVETPRLAKSP